MSEVPQSSADQDETTADEILTYDPQEHGSVFDPAEYLKSFYVSENEDSAMKTVLFFLPGMCLRIPESKTLLDVGSGPTVHVALSFRNRCQEIYLSDFAEQNRRELTKWWENDSDCFDWSAIVHWLSLIEGETRNGRKMPEEARSKIKKILCADVYKESVLSAEDGGQFPSQFDVVTSIFCLEYATKTTEEYRSAFSNVMKLVKPGGYICFGGVMEETSYHFGKTRFRCFYLTKAELFSNLRNNGVDTKGNTFKFVVWEDVFVLVGQKSVGEEK